MLQVFISYIYIYICVYMHVCYSSLVGEPHRESWPGSGPLLKVNQQKMLYRLIEVAETDRIQNRASIRE